MVKSLFFAMSLKDNISYKALSLVFVEFSNSFFNSFNDCLKLSYLGLICNNGISIIYKFGLLLGDVYNKKVNH